MAETLDVAIVGGGPAGAALAVHLARRGIETTLFERRAAPAWHASGVFSSPLTRGHLCGLGLSKERIATLNRPIEALDLETTSGSRCRIEYQHGFACGFDRIELEATLLRCAQEAGASVRMATVVREVRLTSASEGRAALSLSTTSGAADDQGPQSLSARIVVGADGPSSRVVRAAGVARSHRWFRRAGITFHRHDPAALPEGQPMAGRFVFGRGWYMGIAPVPGARVNVGIVVPNLARDRPERVASDLIDRAPGVRQPWMDGATTDHATTAGRLEHHVERAAGRGWLLVGDAVGFVDPLSGEGLLRALASAELAAEAIARSLNGDRDALEVYDRRLRERFFGKNVVSWMLQMFLGQPLLFDYVLSRLARRPRLREDLTLVLTDQMRPSHVVNPRFVARLVAP